MNEVMPRVCGAVMQIVDPKHEWDTKWIYRVQVYTVDDEMKKKIVYEFRSVDMLQPDLFTSQFEAQAALTEKCEQVLGMLNKLGGGSADDMYLNLKTGAFARPGKRKLRG